MGKNLSSFRTVPPFVVDVPAEFSLVFTFVSTAAAERSVLRRLNEVSILGFRPLSKTFFLALISTASTSCFIASRSDTVLLGAVLLSVLVLLIVSIPVTVPGE